jgi:hypothetical protein
MTPANMLLFICFQINGIHFFMQMSNKVCKKKLNTVADFFVTSIMKEEEFNLLLV